MIKTLRICQLSSRIGHVEYALACKDTTPHETDALLEELWALEEELENIESMPYQNYLKTFDLQT